MSRYEIRERGISEHVRRLLGDADPGVLYVVWDTVTDRRVPFGNYSDRHHAQARIARMEDK